MNLFWLGESHALASASGQDFSGPHLTLINGSDVLIGRNPNFVHAPSIAIYILYYYYYYFFNIVDIDGKILDRKSVV